MAWCEGHAVDYLFGLEVNSRLLEILGPALMGAHITYLMTGVASREWADFWYQTRHSWSQPRRVVAKAAFLPGGPRRVRRVRRWAGCRRGRGRGRPGAEAAAAGG